FFAFLQERWPAFLDAQLVHEGGTAREAAPRYGLQFSGPTLLPFDHPDIRIYVDNLFLEGFLQPVEHAEADVLLNTPLAYGVQASPEESRRRRAEGLV